MIKKVHWAVFADESVAVHVTVVEPSPSVVPEAGEHETELTATLSTATALLYVATVVVWPVGGATASSAGQVMFGATLSLTVMKKVQLVVRSALSVATQFTADVVADRNWLPLVTLHTTGLTPEASVAEGVGL